MSPIEEALAIRSELPLTSKEIDAVFANAAPYFK
jgi:hypothetical protein